MRCGLIYWLVLSLSMTKNMHIKEEHPKWVQITQAVEITNYSSSSTLESIVSLPAKGRCFDFVDRSSRTCSVVSPCFQPVFFKPPWENAFLVRWRGRLGGRQLSDHAALGARDGLFGLLRKVSLGGMWFLKDLDCEKPESRKLWRVWGQFSYFILFLHNVLETKTNDPPNNNFYWW